METEGICSISSCNENGRVLGRLGGVNLVYCPKHRKYGQSVINTFLLDVFNYKKSRLFDLAKQELLFGGEKILDEKNYERLGSWFKKEILQNYLEAVGSSAEGIETTLTIREETIYPANYQAGSELGSTYRKIQITQN